MKVSFNTWLIIAIVICTGLLTGLSSQEHHVKGEAIDHSNDNTEIKYENKVVVLMYHHIDPVFKSGATIAPELFHAQLAKLKEKHFNVISMKQFEDFQKGKGSVPPNALLITFDDGYESFYTYAYPELKKWGFPATNFVIVGCTDSPYLSHIRHLTWDQLREMKANNMTFYSHTYNQHDYNAVKPTGLKKPVLLGPTYIEEEARMETQKQYEERVRNDLALAQKRLKEELGGDEQQNIICFPYGAYNQKVIEIAKSLGMDTFFTITPGINVRGNHMVYRVNGGSPKISPDDLIKSIKQHLDPEKNGELFTPPPIQIKLNSKVLNLAHSPYRKEGKIYVPFRAVLEQMGAKVNWDQREQTVTAVKLDKTLMMKLDTNTLQLGGETIKLENLVENEEGTVMIPLRFIAEALGATVKWEDSQQTVVIESK